MTVRSWMRTFEREWLRPLARRLRPLVPRRSRQPGRGRARSRIEELEHRIDALEGLVRELTGVAWLRLDDDAGQPTSAPVPQPAPREAA